MRLASCLLVLGLLCVTPQPGAAQSTDGYSALQVFPVVVDTASFVQRFTFHNANTFDITVTPRYYPAVGTSQATPLTCPAFTVSALASKAVSSLRILCPALPVGSQFGLVVASSGGVQGGTSTFSGYSRVSNTAGAGFSVEAFPMSAFHAGITRATGLRRLAAAAGAPAYQTNCFLGMLPLLGTATTATSVNFEYAIQDKDGVTLATGLQSVARGSIVRLLDVFAAAGLPAGDIDDASIRIWPTGSLGGAISFCTVQDNTSFGADFRIAKTAEYQFLSPIVSSAVRPGAQDIFALRWFTMKTDAMGRPFTIPAGAYANTHVFGFRRPDAATCELMSSENPAAPLTPADGLEIRVIYQGSTLWGGDNSVLVPDPGKGDQAFLGDKDESNGNAQMTLQVESNGQNTGVERAYALRCKSGSGIELPNILDYHRAGTDF